MRDSANYGAERDRFTGDPVGFKYSGTWPRGSRTRLVRSPGGDIGLSVKGM